MDAVDYPSKRRVNKRPVPRMGGVAMAAGIAVALLVEVAGEYFLGWAGFYITDDGGTVNHAGVMCGLLFIVCVGAMDDVYSLKPGVKFGGQLLGATIIATSGLLLSSIANPLGRGFIEFGWMSYPITVLYLVCFMNVINLIDGLDGLAAGITDIAAFFLFLIAYGRGMEETAMLSIVLLGVTLAFLRYNFAPASIFMGDSGSLLLGAMLGVISLMGVMRSPTVIVLAVPLVIAAIPIADTAAAIARRLYHHKPIQQADRKHLHHMLLRKGYGVRKSVVIVYAWTALLGVGAWVMSTSHGVAVWAMILVLLMGSFLILWKLGIFDQVLRHHYHGRHTRQEDKPTWYGRHGR
ncbi:MraY family glycosyltransferase [Adlercreutzia sp. R25]|uniref:MraY family glycosyltransferase n=1 Tax=Adlercreutzia shanghongiae TaxID=3111773 RepID=UPI002DB78C32|nr:MraY family glycosyltransferase [Adlercreutzia sp. R25]MEC4273427.1 MraY family glycosyltransferase [Adlercreutzia sp. R25]